MRRTGVLIAALVFVLAGLGLGSYLLIERWIDRRLEDRSAALRYETDGLRQEADAARQSMLAAQVGLERAKTQARRHAEEAARLTQERQVLIEKVASTAEALEEIRRDAATIPQSEVLGRIRRALANLRTPPPRSGGPAPHGS